MSDTKLYLIGHCEVEYKFRQFGGMNPYFKSRPRFYKIGIASDVESRMSCLRGGTPHKLDLITTVDSNDAETVEKQLHALYSDYRASGEWFKLTANPVNSLMAFNRLEPSDFEALPRRDSSWLKNNLSLYTEVMKQRANTVGGAADE